MKKLIYLLFPAYRFGYQLFSTAKINFYMWKLKFKLRSLGKNNRIYFANITEPCNVSIGHHVYINKNCDIIIPAELIEEAYRVDLNKFKQEKLDWRLWGVSKNENN